jgi:hypothetical protein
VPLAEASFGGADFLPLKDLMRQFVRQFVLALALVSSTSAAFAQTAPQPPRSGTPEEQAACNRDVQRHCRNVVNQGDFVILACLQQNRTQISAACNQVLKNHGQ